MTRAGAACLALALLLAPAVARAQFVPDSTFDQPPPPPPRFETVPPPPAPGLAWSAGKWVWDGITWRWRHGRYRSRLLARDAYRAGHWEQDAGAGFRWVPGTMQ